MVNRTTGNDGGALPLFTISKSAHGTIVAVSHIERAPPIDIQPGIVAELGPNADLSDYQLCVNTKTGRAQMLLTGQEVPQGWEPYLTFAWNAKTRQFDATTVTTAQREKQYAR